MQLPCQTVWSAHPALWTAKQPQVQNSSSDTCSSTHEAQIHSTLLQILLVNTQSCWDLLKTLITLYTGIYTHFSTYRMPGSTS